MGQLRSSPRLTWLYTRPHLRRQLLRKRERVAGFCLCKVRSFRLGPGGPVFPLDPKGVPSVSDDPFHHSGARCVIHGCRGQPNM